MRCDFDGIPSKVNVNALEFKTRPLEGISAKAFTGAEEQDGLESETPLATAVPRAKA